MDFFLAFWEMDGHVHELRSIADSDPKIEL